MRIHKQVLLASGLCCAFSLAFGRCLPKPDLYPDCRYGAGDSWCRTHGGLNRFAYEDACLNDRPPVPAWVHPEQDPPAPRLEQSNKKESTLQVSGDCELLASLLTAFDTANKEKRYAAACDQGKNAIGALTRCADSIPASHPVTVKVKAFTELFPMQVEDACKSAAQGQSGNPAPLAETRTAALQVPVAQDGSLSEPRKTPDMLKTTAEPAKEPTSGVNWMKYLLGAGVLGLLYAFMAVYNQVKMFQVGILEQKAEIDSHTTQLGKVYAQMRQIMEQYAIHERDAFKTIAAGQANVALLATKYPELKANKIFQNASNSCDQLFDELNATIVTYNRTISAHNIYVTQFPRLLICLVFGYRVKTHVNLADFVGNVSFSITATPV